MRMRGGLSFFNSIVSIVILFHLFKNFLRGQGTPVVKAEKKIVQIDYFFSSTKRCNFSSDDVLDKYLKSIVLERFDKFTCKVSFDFN